MPSRDVAIRKILILRFSSLGDIVMSTAMVRCLRQRFPTARIDMVVREDFIDLIRNNPHLDRKIGLPREQGIQGLFRLLVALKREHYDLVYDAHFSVRSLFLSLFLRAPITLFFQKHYLRRGFALTFKLPLLKHFDRMLVRYIDPLTEFGVKFDDKGPELFPTPFAKHSPSLTIGLIPSAQWPGKRWPTGRFKELAHTIETETDWRMVVYGGRSDTFCSEIAQGISTARIDNLQGKLSIEETTDHLSGCDFVIANDTGLMHMADALQIPTILILGPTSREMGCIPFHPLSLIVEVKNLWCRPCSKNGQAPCIRRKRYCLEIDAKDVFQKALELSKALKPRVAQ